VSLVFVWVLLRVGGIDEVASRLRGLPLETLALAFLWLVLSGLLRAMRLRLLLAGRPAVTRLYALNQVYNFGSAVIPTGPGELFGAWIIGRGVASPIGTTMVALLLTRVLDLVVVLAMFLIVYAAGAVELRAFEAPLVGLAAAIVATVAVAVASRTLVTQRLKRWLANSPPRRRGQALITRALAPVVRALAAFEFAAVGTSPWMLLASVTLASQLANLYSLVVLLGGMGRPTRIPEAISILVMYLFLRTLPVQGVAGVGTHAAWWALALSGMGDERGEAVLLGTLLYLSYSGLLIALFLTALPLLWTRRGAVVPR
jgi:hypothetical protein